jgi:hypothetical protein
VRNLHQPSFQKFHEFLVTHQVNLKEWDIFDILKISKRFPYQFHHGHESICLLDNLGTKLRKELFDIYGFLDFDKFKNFYDKGFSFIISDVLDINDELKKIEQVALETFGVRICGNFYFSKGLNNQNVSFPEHTDDYCLFIKNIYGESVWNIDKKETIIKDQNVQFINRMTPHCVTSIKEPRLSLSLAIYKQD